jgi:hypothetical protein
VVLLIASARLKNDKVDAPIWRSCCARICCRRRGSPRRRSASSGRGCGHRIGLVGLRNLLRNRIHAVLADHGHHRAEGCWTGPGRVWLHDLQLPPASREVIADCPALMALRI